MVGLLATVSLGQVDAPAVDSRETTTPSNVLAPSIPSESVADSERILTIAPSVPIEIGGEPPFELDSWIEQTLRDDNIQFMSVMPPGDLPVSASAAVGLANKVTASSLTRQPIKITVEYVGYTDPYRGFRDKKVWKVTYWGSPMLLEGPAPAPGERSSMEQPSSQRAITWVLIDLELGATRDPITTFSSGPVGD